MATASDDTSTGNASAQPDWATRYRGRRIALYFESAEQRAEFEEKAASEGYANKFSTWCVRKIREAANGTFYEPEFVESLEARIAELETGVQYERARANQAEAQVRELQEKVTHYADQFLLVANKLRE